MPAYSWCATKTNHTKRDVEEVPSSSSSPDLRQACCHQVAIFSPTPGDVSPLVSPLPRWPAPEPRDVDGIPLGSPAVAQMFAQKRMVFLCEDLGWTDPQVLSGITREGRSKPDLSIYYDAGDRTNPVNEAAVSMVRLLPPHRKGGVSCVQDIRGCCVLEYRPTITRCVRTGRTRSVAGDVHGGLGRPRTPKHTTPWSPGLPFHGTTAPGGGVASQARPEYHPMVSPEERQRKLAAILAAQGPLDGSTRGGRGCYRGEDEMLEAHT